jgi:hypothetical protein
MLNRYLSLAVPVCFAVSMVALAQTPGAGAEYLFQLPGSNASGQFVPYYAVVPNNLTPIANTAGPNGINAIVPMPDGSKFYLISSLGIESVDPTFQNFSGTITLTEPSGLVPTVTAATLTPNGQYLLVGTLDSSNSSFLFLVNTSNNTAVTGTGFPIQLGGTPGPYNSSQSAPCPGCWIAVSRDSKTAYVIENSVFGGNTQVVAYSLTTFQKIGAATTFNNVGSGFPGAGNALTLSPQNVLYLAANNAITLIDPVALQQIGTSISLGGFNCGQLQFTPDGTTAYAINQSPRGSGAASLLALTPATSTIAYWPTLNSANGPQLTSVFVAGNNNCPSGHCIFAYSSPAALGTATGTFYDVTPVTGGLNASVSQPSPTLATALTGGGQPCPGVASVAECVLAATVSNELPASNFLYVLIANGNEPYLDRISLSTDTVSVSNGSPVLGTASNMEFVSIPVQSTPTSFITFNNVQTVNPGGTSLPLIARAIGGVGLPVFNEAGVFSAPSSTGLVINTPNWTTGADGYALTTVTVPAAGATCPSAVCTVTYTLDGQTTTFSINVPGSGPSGGGTGPGGGGSTSTQVIITNGQGQLVLIDNAGPLPLSVEVTDANGNPLPNVSVSFTVTQGNGLVNPTSAVTDATGTASTFYFAEAVTNGNNSFETDVIVASAPQGSATFYETAYLNPTNLNTSGVEIEFPNQSGITIQVAPGSPVQNAITAYVSTIPFGGFTSTPIPNVGLSIVSAPGSTGPPPVSCQGNPVTDVTGNVSCTLVTTCATQAMLYGGAQFQVSLGGTIDSTPPLIQVIPGGGGASQIAITSGNNQSGNTGQRAGLPLIATLTSFCGAPVVGTTVNWSVTQGSATLQSATSTSNVEGQVSNVLTFGKTPGTVTVTATISGGASVSFTLTNTVVVSGITAVSGTGQSATVNQGFANPLVVSVFDNNHNPVSGLAVTFTVSSNGGTATVNPTSTDTGANGQAQTSVTAGSVAGPVMVTASITGGFTATFTLAVLPAGPTVTATSFVNAASSVSGLVPCGLGTVTGAGLATAVQGVVSGLSPFGPLPYTLAGLSITINAIPAPIEAVANQNGVQQVNFQTPCETAGSTSATVVITVNNASTTVTGVPVFAAQPGIFTYAGPNNLPYGAVIGNGGYVTPQNLAQRGQTYYVVVTGLGQTNPPLATDNPGVAGDNVVPTMVVGVNNTGVQVVSAYALPDQIGVYLVGFVIPLTTPPSSTAVPLSVAAVVNGTVVYSNSVYLAGIM